MNRGFLIGKAIKKPLLRLTEPKKGNMPMQVNELILAVYDYTDKEGQDHFCQVQLTAWNELAERLETCVNEGDLLQVEYKANCRLKQFETNNYWVTSLTIKSFFNHNNKEKGDSFSKKMEKASSENSSPNYNLEEPVSEDILV